MVFFLTGLMIFVIELRTTSTRVFNQFRSAAVAQERLRQQLRGRQLRMETLISPGSVEKEATAVQRPKRQ